MPSRSIVLLLGALAPSSLAFQLAARAPASAAARVAAAPQLLLGIGEDVEKKGPGTIQEAKEAFQAEYGRPVNGQYQGFVGEILTGVTLSRVHVDYKPSRVFYLGMETLCTVFLANVPTEEEREKLFVSLCAGVAFDPKQLRAEAAKLTGAASGQTEESFFASQDLTQLAASGVQYSYVLGTGLIALMPMVGVEPSDEAIERWCTKLNLPASRMQKDYAFFKDAQEKMAQTKQMMMEMAAAAKRKEAKKLQEDAAKAAKDASEAESAAAEA